MKKAVLLAIGCISYCIANSQNWQTLNDSLLYYYQQGNFIKALEFGEKGLLKAKEETNENHPQYASALSNLASVYESLGRYSEVEALILKALEIRKKFPGEKKLDYGESINNLAQYNSDIGNYAQAETLYLEVLQILKMALGETHLYYAITLNNLAGVYEEMGEYNKAEPLYLDALNVYKKEIGADSPEYAISLNNLANLYQKMGIYTKAELFFKETLSIRKKTLGEENKFYASCLNNLANLYMKMRDDSLAEPLFLRSIEIYKKIKADSHPDYAATINNLSILYKLQGRYDKAEKLLTEAMNIDKKTLGDTHPKYAMDMNNLGNLYEHMGNYSKAEIMFTDALSIRIKALGENHSFTAESQISLGRLYERMGQYARAEPYFLRNSNIVIRNIKSAFTVMSEKEKEAFMENAVSLSNSENTFLFHYSNASSVILNEFANNQLLFKGLILDDSKRILASIIGNRDTSVSELYNNWQKQRKLLSKQYALPIQNRMENLSAVESRCEDLEKDLNRRSAGFRNINGTFEVKGSQVLEKLSDNEAAIEFIKFNVSGNNETDSTIYAAYVFTSANSFPAFVPLFEERQLQKILDSAGATSTAMVDKLYRGVEIKSNAGTGLGKDLYRLVWSPLEPHLKGITRVSFSPAGKLYGISFHSMIIDSTRLLMDNYELHQHASIRQLALNNNEKAARPKNIVLFGDADFSMDSLQLISNKKNQIDADAINSVQIPDSRGNYSSTWPRLIGTGKEVNSIQRLFSVNKITPRSFTRSSASEGNLKLLSGHSPQILHIATHGFFLPVRSNNSVSGNALMSARDPLLRSGLILSGGNYAWSGKTPIEGIEDGIVTAYEISQLDLSNTELVVLSACETALGDIKGTEGVFGLQRAFKMAGVKKMIVSLWQVPDKETAELMKTFYSYWLKGKTIDQAFAQTQSDMRKKYSPYYWAAFVLIE